MRRAQPPIALLLISLAIALGLGTHAQSRPVAAQTVEGGFPIAHGISTLYADGSGNGAWRVVRDTAAPAGESRFVERALGFTLANEAPILIESDTTDTSTIVPLNGADFVNEFDVESRTSLTDAPASYLRIALVLPSEVNDVANGELVFAGESFTVPTGPRALTLQGYQIEQDEAITVPDSNAPVLVVVSSGSVTDSDGNQIGAGAAATVASGSTLTANEDQTVVSLGLVGEQVGTSSGGNSSATTSTATATSTSTPSPTEPGEGETVEHAVTLSAVDCSNGDRISLEGCEPLSGVTFSVARGDDTSSSETGVITDDGGAAQFTVPDGWSVTARYLSNAPGELSPIETVVTIDAVTQAELITFVFVPTERSSNVLTITALDCTNGDIESSEGCTPLPGVVFVVAVGNGTSSSENGVTTGNDGRVALDISEGFNATATYQGGAPEGLQPRYTSLTSEGVMTDGELIFVFAPQD